MTPEGAVGRYTETHVFFVRVLPRKQIYLYKKLNDPTDISQIQCHVFLFQTKKLIHVIYWHLDGKLGCETWLPFSDTEDDTEMRFQ